MTPKTRRIALVAVVLVVGIGGFLAFRPDKLFVDDRVDEQLADAFASGGTGTTTEPIETPEGGEPAQDTPATTATSTASAPATTLPVETTEPGSTTSTAPPAPRLVSTGGFIGIDHTAVGTASIFEQDGRYVLRFEDDTDIQNGPDLYVWMVGGTDWDNPTEILDLGKLKGNVGGQNYLLGDEYDPEIHRNVLVWCLRFDVPFAAAELS